MVVTVSQVIGALEQYAIIVLSVIQEKLSALNFAVCIGDFIISFLSLGYYVSLTMLYFQVISVHESLLRCGAQEKYGRLLFGNRKLQLLSVMSLLWFCHVTGCCWLNTLG